MRKSKPSMSVIVSVKDATRASWKYTCAKAGAAGISIVNEVTDEYLPNLPRGFRYMETGYILSDGIPWPDPGFLVTCSCTMSCEDAKACECQGVRGADDDIPRTYAYDSRVSAMRNY